MHYGVLGMVQDWESGDGIVVVIVSYGGVVGSREFGGLNGKHCRGRGTVWLSVVIVLACGIRIRTVM